MMHAAQKLIRMATVTAAFACGLFVTDDVRIDGLPSLVSTADARVGRPATPMSYAGVARRTTRRTVAAGAAVGAAAATTRCTQVVDAYGRTVTRCY